MRRFSWTKSSLACVLALMVWAHCPGILRAQVSVPDVTAASAVVMEWSTGTLVYEKNGFVKRHPASLTKIMTAIVTLENGYLGDVVKVSERAAYETGSYMGLSPGDLYTLEDLLYGAMLPSGNDACVAIAEHVGGGSVQRFVNMMNQKAMELGALDTWFCNPHGLTEDEHLTTAYDLALITRYAMRIPLFTRIVSTPQHDAWRLQDMRVNPLFSTNKLLLSYPEAEGVKTGTTSAAGLCLVAAASRGGVRYIAVILDSYDRWGDARKLLSYALDNYVLASNPLFGKTAGQTKVLHGNKPNVEGVVPGPPCWVVPKDQAQHVEARGVLYEQVAAPVSKGEQIGRVVALRDGDLVDDVPVIAARDVGERSWATPLLNMALSIVRAMARARLG